MVTLDVTKGWRAISKENPQEDFPVVVQVTAPSGKEVPRAAVDVVAVVDGAGGDEALKEAMHAIVDGLGSSDRLAVVAADVVDMGLKEMTSYGDRSSAKRRINELTTMAHAKSVKAALREGAKVLRRRGEEERRNRVGCIVLLSAGAGDEMLSEDEEISPDYPVHTLGVGAGHDPRALYHIAAKTSGTYHCVHHGDDVRGALAMFMYHLTSIIARDVRIELTMINQGVAISSIEASGHGHTTTLSSITSTIEIANLCSGETRSFVVYLTVANAKATARKLMIVRGQFRRSLRDSKPQPMEEIRTVSVLRAMECQPEDLAIGAVVATELVRVRLRKRVSAMAAAAELPAGDRLRQLKEEIKGIPDESVLRELGNSVDGMSELPYTLSWLTCGRCPPPSYARPKRPSAQRSLSYEEERPSKKTRSRL